MPNLRTSATAAGRSAPPARGQGAPRIIASHSDAPASHHRIRARPVRPAIIRIPKAKVTP